MNTSELKNDLHKFIVETNDITILSKVKEYVSSLRKESSDWWDEMTEEDKSSVQRGLDDLEAGRVHSDEDVRRSIRQKIEAAK